MDSADKLQQFLPSLARGVYRFNGQLGPYLQDTDVKAFVDIKKAFLPRQYRDAIEKLAEISVDKSISLLNRLPSLGNNKKAEKIADEFFENHTYLKHENNNNYLERKFVQLILARIFNLDELLARVAPQYPVEKYRIDFSIFGEKQYAIELDGFGKFKDRSDLNGFLNRQNTIVHEGWTLYRFSYADVIENTAATLKHLRDILGQDRELAHIINGQAQTNLFDFDNNGKPNSCLIVDYFYAIQDVFYTEAINVKAPKERVAVSEQLGFDFSLVTLALSDLYYYFDGIKAIFDLDFDLPDIEIDKSLWKKIRPYLTEVHPKIKSATIQNPDLKLNKLRLQEAIDYSEYRGHSIDHVAFRPDTTVNPIQAVQTKLRYFAKSIFGYEKIHYGQDEIFAKILSKQDVLGLLPTGKGKSFCFWLPALIKPGLTIVISPLRALMRDQIASLKLFGIYSTAFINSDVDNYQRLAIYTDIKLGRVRLLYISPERMQIRSFISELDEILQIVPVNFLVIDEAHCVSEWGHDFRPSYLRIPYFAERLRSENLNPDMTVISLTATAGEIVKKDMMTILNLDESNVVSAKNFNRPNLSLQFIAVNSYDEKAKAYERIFKQWLPTALHRKNIEKIFQASDDGSIQKGVGLVFCIYADSHGKHTIKDSVGHYLRETQWIVEKNGGQAETDFGEGRIRGFASKVPNLCPHCASSEYITDRGQNDGLVDDFEGEFIDNDDTDDLNTDKKKSGLKICTNCGGKFTAKEALKPKNWEKVLRLNQEAFKAGEIDLMVTTKGFGMGIDKGSVRFVVHTSMAGGMESWYQEAGRAGRDGVHAHCISIVDVPNQACLNAMAQNNDIPDCTQSRCPHGKQGLCDYGKQHVFIQKSYPSVAADTMAMLRCLDKLIIEHENRITPIVLKTSKDYLKNFELALYRLQELAIVGNYNIEYKGRNIVIIEVSHFNANADELLIKAKLQEYLNKHDLKNNSLKTNEGIEYSIIQSTRANQEEVKRRIQQEQRNGKLTTYREPDLFDENEYYQLYQLVMGCAFVMLEHIYTDIRGMRYGMLKDLLDLPISNTCYRSKFLPYFGTETPPNYKCEFCDNCHPNLIFTEDGEYRYECKDMEIPGDLQEKSKNFKDWLTNAELLNIEKAEFYIQAFKDYPDNAYWTVKSILNTGNPRNLKALYIARHFAGQDEKLKYSLRLVETANMRKRIELSAIWTIYQTTEDQFKPQAFELLLDDLGMLLNSANGEQWLYDEAEILYQQRKINKQTVEILGLRTLGNQLSQMDFSLHKNKLQNMI